MPEAGHESQTKYDEVTLSDLTEHVLGLVNSERLGHFKSVEVVEVFASGRACLIGPHGRVQFDC